ncbi:MAG: NnrS family protein [Alcaligenaceae bacterium]|nr:NnrS family protein [Alcaligenaceae bacterium]
MADTLHMASPGINTNEQAPSLKPDLDAFLSLGFRPLYIAGCAWALVSIALWIFMPHWLQQPLYGLAWHAHEMLWGFIGTIAVGFLLTASATWTGHNPARGATLAGLCLLWLAARPAYLVDHPLAFQVGLIAESLFFGLSALVLMRVMLKGNSRRNYGVPLMVLGLGLTNILFLLASQQGNYLVLMQRFDLGLLCMAMLALLIGRRVIPFFAMRMVPGLALPMQVRSGQIQLGATGIAIALGLAGQQVLMAPVLAFTGLVSLWQVMGWKPAAVLHKPMLWILYLGYGALGAGLLLAALHSAGLTSGALGRSATHVHTIGMGGFAVLIIGMVTRTALGHLGRPLQLDASMLVSYWLMIAAVVLRLLALLPSAASTPLLHASAACWITCMALYLWRFVPMLIRPRPDRPLER